MGFIGNQGLGKISYTNLGSVKGKVADVDALNSVTGMSNGDLYLQEDNEHANIYDGSEWVDLGPIVGPAGSIGPIGPAGTIDHIAKTGGAVESGATATYTAYADTDEAQTLGTFDVYSGIDATTYYTWVKYADDDTGSGMSDDPSGKNYIGIAYNKTTNTESTEAGDYAWSLIKGADGTGTVDSVVAGTNIVVDSSDENNPVVSVSDTLAEKAQDVDTSTVYADKTTDATYKLYMDNGEIVMEEL